MSTVVTECRDCASWVPWEEHLPTCSRPCDRRMPSWSDHAASCPTCYYGTWKLGKDVTAEVSNLFACPVRLSAGLNDAYVRLGANQPLDMVRLDVVAWLAALALERALSAPPLFVGGPVACDGRVTFEVLVAGDRPPLECVARLAGSAVHLMLAGEDEA